MTPDQKIQAWTAVLTSLPTIVFTGVLAFWNWKRDQERVIVQIAPQYLYHHYATGPNRSLYAIAITVKNLSLFPIRIESLAFLKDGKTIHRLDRVGHDSEWPEELAVHSTMTIFTKEYELDQLSKFGTLETLISDEKIHAAASTVTGIDFYSNRLSVRIWRPLRHLRERLRRGKTVLANVPQPSR